MTRTDTAPPFVPGAPAAPGGTPAPAPATRAAGTGRPARPRGGRRRGSPTAWVDALVLGAATALAVLPMLPVFGLASGLPALAAGVLLGAGLAAAGARRSWGALSNLATVVVAYLVVGPAVAAPTLATARALPSLESTTGLLRGVVTVWKEVLTLDPELGASGHVLAAPLLLALLSAGASVAIAARIRGPAAAWAALVPLAALGVAVLLGTKVTVVPVVAGTLLVLLLLPWVAWRRGTLAPRRVVALGLVLVAVVGGGVAGPFVLGDQQRFVLRDEMVPPFDPNEHPSPLSAFRSFVKQYRETELFTVRGLPEGARVRLATMDAYDGVVWKVAGSQESEGSGSFRRVGETIATSVAGTRTRVEFEVHELPGVWLPTVGYAERFSFDGPDALARTRDLRYNDATGTAVLTSGVPAGTTWTVAVVVPEQPEVEELAGASQGSTRLPTLRGVPDAVALYAGEIAASAGSPAQIAANLAEGLAERGYFSHGVLPDEEPSLSGHGADRITTLLTGDLMVGDGEQYAAAMALMARQMGLPARVVMGFVPDEHADEVTITGEDVEAWVEVEFAGRGWVAFDPTPDESRTPRTDEREQQAAEDPQVRQPPPPLPEPVDPPDEDTEQPSTRDEPDEDAADEGWAQVLLVAAAVGVPLLLLLTPVLVVLAAKARRRRRRRTAPDPVARVVGGWDELLDEARDLRAPAPPTATRRETAVHLAQAFAPRGRSRRGASVGAAVAGLAASADAVVFGAGTPPEEHVAVYWREVEAARAALRSAVPRRRRLRARLSTASLRYRRKARAATRS
jgi:transglutaminase-like putative cysteine protease